MVRLDLLLHRAEMGCSHSFTSNRCVPFRADVCCNLGPCGLSFLVSVSFPIVHKRKARDLLYVRAYRVAQHHLREGHLLTQTQEEMILIGGFGLFWLGTSAFSPGFIPPAALPFPPSLCLTVDGGPRFCPPPRIPGD